MVPEAFAGNLLREAFAGNLLRSCPRPEGGVGAEPLRERMWPGTWWHSGRTHPLPAGLFFHDLCIVLDRGQGFVILPSAAHFFSSDQTSCLTQVQ